MRPIDADAIPWDVEGVGEIPVITKEEIDEMPTVDAVKHGHWIEVDDAIISCKCSVCGAEYIIYEDDINGYPYCAKCGARMDAIERKEE